MFTLAAAGKTNRKGMPNPLRLAVIANEYFDTVRLPFPPAFLQRIALALGSPVLGPRARLSTRLFPRRRGARRARCCDGVGMRLRLLIVGLAAAALLLAAVGLALDLRSRATRAWRGRRPPRSSTNKGRRAVQ